MSSEEGVRPFRLLHVFLVIGMTVAATGLFAYSSWCNYREVRGRAIEDSIDRGQKALFAFEDHTERLFEFADSHLRSVRAYYHDHGAGEHLRRHLVEVRALRQAEFAGILTITDRAGNVIFHSEQADPPQVNLSSLAYFQSLRDGGRDDLVIDPTRLGRVTGQYQFRLVRPVFADSMFDGVIIQTMLPAHIVDFHRALDLGRGSSLTVLTMDRRLIARTPAVGDATFAQAQEGLKIWREVEAAPSGVYFGQSPFDGLTRYYFYKKMSDYPAVMVLGLPHDEILLRLAGTRANIIEQVALFAAVAGSFCVMTIAILVKNHRLSAAEKSAHAAVEELRRSNEDLERFAYVVSHDLQSPLRTVCSYVQLLDRRCRDHLDGDAKEFMGFIVDGTRRMSRLITDLLEYARVSSRGKPLAPVEARVAADAALANLAAIVEETGASVSLGDLPSVLADESQLTCLFQNLIGNAIRYRHPDRPPRITVAARRESDTHWGFTVSDNGIGIERQYFSKIFEIFQRIDPERHPEGTGVGLAICQRIVHRLGGEIRVDSEPGRGSTFSFTLRRA